MILGSVAEQASGVVIAIAIVVAIVAFVVFDVSETAGRLPGPTWLRGLSKQRWPIGIVAIVLAVSRVLVLA